MRGPPDLPIPAQKCRQDPGAQRGRPRPHSLAGTRHPRATTNLSLYLRE